MSIKSRRIYLWLATITVFCLSILATQSTWKSLPEVFVFQNGSANIYFGQFYAPQHALSMNFSNGTSGNGQAIISRNGVKIAPSAQTGYYRFFSYISGDLLCSASSCRKLNADGVLIEKLEPNGWWSTKVTRVSSADAPIDRTFYLQSTAATELVLTKPDFSGLEVRTLHEGTNQLKIDELGKYRSWRLTYAAIFSLCCFGLALLLYQYRAGIASAFRVVPLYSSSLAIVLALEYLSVFPGMFSTDTVARQLSSDQFDTWFSSAFMAFSRLTYSFYPSFIQIPEIFIYYASSIYLAIHLKKVQNGRILLLFLFFLQLIVPVFFVSLFVQQRIFLAVIVLYAAIILACCNILIRGKLSPLAYTALICAALLRPEYWLIFLVFLSHDAWQSWKTPTFHIKPIALVLLSAVSAHLLVNHALVPMQGADRGAIAPYYKFASLLDIAKPYVACENSSDVLSKTIEKSGGLQNYCSQSAEAFFWSKRAVSTEDMEAINTVLTSELIVRMLNDPKPAIKRIFMNLADMSTQDYWQIYNRYADRESNINNIHILLSDKYGLTQYFEWQSKLHFFAVETFISIAKYVNVSVSLLFIIILVPILSRSYMTILLNSAFLLMTLVVSLGAPVSQWYYLVFVPIWSVLVIPIDAILFGNIKNARARFRLEMAQSFANKDPSKETYESA